MNYDFVLSAGVAALIVAAIYALYLLRQWLQQSELRQLVEIYVGDAEKRIEGGAAKLDWVLSKIKERHPKVDINLVRSMIEAAVVHLPASTGDGKSATPASPEWR